MHAQSDMGRTGMADIQGLNKSYFLILAVQVIDSLHSLVTVFSRII